MVMSAWNHSDMLISMKHKVKAAAISLVLHVLDHKPISEILEDDPKIQFILRGK